MKSRGFTFIELIIVVAILLVLSSGIIVSYNSYTNSERVRQAGLTLKSDLRLVASKINAGTKPIGCTSLVSYEVTFTTLCEGTRSCYTTTPVCANDRYESTITYVAKDVQLTASISTVRFFPLSAGTDVPIGTSAIISLRGVSTSKQVFEITISSSGTISDRKYESN